MEEVAANQTAVPQTKSWRTTSMKPIVINLKKKKKKKRRYSRGLKEIQERGHHLTRVRRRMSQAISKGNATYIKHRDQSAKNKRDGAIRDFVPNVGSAMSRSLREASDIPDDLSKAFNTKRSRRHLRRQLRGASRSLRVFRL